MRYYYNSDPTQAVALSFDAIGEAAEVFHAGPRTINCGQTAERSAVIVSTALKIKSVLSGRRELPDIVLVGEEAAYALEGLSRMAASEADADARHREAARAILGEQTEWIPLDGNPVVPPAEAYDAYAVPIEGPLARP